jgi:hydroxyacylglutathione hydrolase
VAAFVAQSAAISAPKPPNLTRIVETNHGPLFGALPLAPELAAPTEQAQLLDVRPASEHLAGHRPGAINVPVAGSSFATKAGFVLDATQPVCVLAGTVDEARGAIRRLQAVAFFDIAGYVLGGGDEHTDGVAVDELERFVGDGATVVDVREPDEREAGFIPGSLNIPYRLVGSARADLPTDSPVVTICESGARAAVAASVLRARGYDARPVIDGGLAEWRRRGGAIATARS